jgi:hypothetical protein
MWGLILYVIFVIVGAMISAAVGFYVENAFSPALSLIVFLTMFFGNFVVSWFLTLLIVERVVHPRIDKSGSVAG